MTKFLTFGGPNKNYHDRVSNLCTEAAKLNFFSEIIGLTDNDLKSDEKFWRKHCHFIDNNLKGYGFWIWKPYIIQKYLQAMDSNDILIYMDAGCSINTRGKKRLREYIDIINNQTEHGILSFQMNHLEEIKYTKRKLFEHFKTDIQDIQSGQCMATVIIVKKTLQSMKIINEWYDVASIPHLLNDDIGIEDYRFTSHRHDQSIYSLLVKKYGSIKIPDETYFAPDWKTGVQFPFWATRIRNDSLRLP